MHTITLLPITLFLLLAQAIPSSAAAFPRTPHALNDAVDRLHRLAVRNSAGLAHDLRLAFGSVLAREPSKVSLSSHRVYCTASKNPTTTSSSPGNGPGRHGTSTRNANPSATNTAPAPGTTLPPSRWKLVESHVRFALTCVNNSKTTSDNGSKGMISFRDGISTLALIQHTVSVRQ
jgi:hypothetical protein